MEFWNGVHLVFSAFFALLGSMFYFRTVHLVRGRIHDLRKGDGRIFDSTLAVVGLAALSMISASIFVWWYFVPAIILGFWPVAMVVLMVGKSEPVGAAERVS